MSEISLSLECPQNLTFVTTITDDYNYSNSVSGYSKVGSLLPMVKLLISTVLAVWVSAIALVSVQNATPVSLRFLVFQSVQIPIGLLLGFSASLGMIGGALLLPQGKRGGDRFDED